MISIYTLCNPVTKVIFYVGATTDPKARLYAHTTDNKINSYKYRKIKEILNMGLLPKIKIVYKCFPDEVNKFENYYTDYYKSLGAEIEVKKSNYNSFGTSLISYPYYLKESKEYHASFMDIYFIIKFNKKSDNIINNISFFIFNKLI